MSETDPDRALRILLVEAIEPVRGMLARDLSAAGHEVDTLSSGNGFTEDMVRLIHPDLVLVDPFLPDVSIDDVERTLASLRADLGFKLLVIDGGQDSGRVARLAAACRADGAIAKEALLASPADAVAEQLLPEVDVLEPLEEALPSASAAAELGLEIDLTPEPPQPRRAPLHAQATSAARPSPNGLAARPRPPLPPQSGAAGILAMIEEELGQVPKAPAPSLDRFEAGINLFSRHNLYVGTSGDLRTGGVFVATSFLPRVGDLVKVRIELPFAGALEAEGCVEWVRDGQGGGARIASGAGISLAHLPEATRHLLEQFFRERAPLTHLPRR